MKDFDQLMSVWQGQPKQDQLSVDDVLKQVKKGMTTMSRKLLWSIVSMSISLVVVLGVMLFFCVSIVDNLFRHHHRIADHTFIHCDADT